MFLLNSTNNFFKKRQKYVAQHVFSLKKFYYPISVFYREFDISEY